MACDYLYIGIRYRCMGSWYAVKNGVGYIFAAVGAVVQADIRERFKCMVSSVNNILNFIVCSIFCLLIAMLFLSYSLINNLDLVVLWLIQPSV